jgi:transcriptional regulator GlxA family with amidase domain
MRDVAFVVYPDYSAMALAVVMAFEVANSVAETEAPPYELHFVSETGGKIRTSCGMMLESEPFTEMPFHTCSSAAQQPRSRRRLA